MRLRMSYVICWARGSKFYTHQVRHKKEAGDMYPQSRYYIHISLKSFVYIGKENILRVVCARYKNRECASQGVNARCFKKNKLSPHRAHCAFICKFIKNTLVFLFVYRFLSYKQKKASKIILFTIKSNLK